MADDKKLAPEGAGPPPGAVSRRLALGAMGTAAAAGVVAAATGASAQTRAAGPATFELPIPPAPKPPIDELVNLWQYEDQARIAIGQARLAAITGSDRTVTDRMTLWPRINIPGRDLDLTSTLFGDEHFAPIIVGPMANQKRFHPEGELATARGASKAKAAMILSADSDTPLAEVAAATTSPVWLQVYAGSPKVSQALAQAKAAKAKAVVVTVNAGPAGAATPAGAINWAAVDAVVKGTSLPVVVKGITTPAEARQAVAHGAKGVIVSNWRGGNNPALPGTLLMIEPVVQAVGAQVPVLADGSFRYGSDALKALALGAKAVIIGRPVMWGLASYGADGVQGVTEFMQTDLARFAAMCGCPTFAAINRGVVKIHAPIPTARNA